MFQGREINSTLVKPADMYGGVRTGANDSMWRLGIEAANRRIAESLYIEQGKDLGAQGI